MEEPRITTRANARRQRSQSKEVQHAPISNGKASKERGVNINLEAVAEEIRPASALPNGSQKSVRTESSMIIPSPASSQASDSRPLSPPLSLSRAQEKTELQNLNDRLAKVLSTLSDAQHENQQLKVN